MKQGDYKKYAIPLGKVITSIREAKGWSIQYLAIASNISVVEMACIERGEIDITFNTLLQIATTFNVDIKELFRTLPASI